MRSSKEITDEFTNLCMQIGNDVFNFELRKTHHMSKFMQLQQEMQETVKAESEQVAVDAITIDKTASNKKVNKFNKLAGK